MTKPVCVGLIGLGTVGGGVAKILLEKESLIAERAGIPVVLKRIVDKYPDRVKLQVPKGLLSTDINDIFNDKDISIVIELMGGHEPARTFILQAIERGKHVVTANKALLAVHGKEIFTAAGRKGVDVGFEASVGGGIPVIRAVREGLVGDRIESILGIMNGTSNYILSKMTDEGRHFGEVLKEAQAQGYAEADPTYDIEGIDTAHKLAIISTLAYGCFVRLEDIFTEGISKIEPIDIGFARELGYRIKLLAISRCDGQSVEARIHPTMIPSSHLLASVNGVYNAFYLHGDAVGQVLLYGFGAGMMPTGSAVVSDVVDIARNVAKGTTQRVPPLSTPIDKMRVLSIKPMDDLVCRYYMRFSAVDSPGVLSKISGILGSNGISIESVIQKGRDTKDSVPVVMMTHEAREKDVRQAVEQIDRLDIVTAKTMFIRIENRLQTE
ncbi:MAG: homoserine dehydrogenase [Pseudomonadota bacterium]